MKAISIAEILVSLSLLINLTSACGHRSNETPSLSTMGLSNQPLSQPELTSDEADKLEELIKDQFEVLNKLSTEKLILEERSASLGAQISSHNDQLAINKTLTIAATVELKYKITSLGTEKAALDKTIADLSAKNVELQKRLDDNKAASVILQKDLDAAKQQAAAEAAATTTASTANFYSFKYTDPSKVKPDCLGVSASSTAENAAVVSSPCGSKTALIQQFSVIDPANQFFQIKARNSEKCLVVSSLTEAAAVLQKTCTSGLENNWEFLDRGQASFRLRNQYSGKCMKIQADGKISQGICETNSSFYSWFIAGQS